MDPILTLLREDASLTVAELSNRLGQSKEKVAQAIQDYETRRVILGYRTLINEKLLGGSQVRAAIEVRSTPEREGGFHRLATRIAKHREVRTCCLMSGTYNFLVIVEGSSLDEVAAFVAEKLAVLEGVVSTSTHFMLKSYKEHGVLIHQDEDAERLKVSP